MNKPEWHLVSTGISDFGHWYKPSTKKKEVSLWLPRDYHHCLVAQKSFDKSLHRLSGSEPT